MAPVMSAYPESKGKFGVSSLQIRSLFERYPNGKEALVALGGITGVLDSVHVNAVEGLPSSEAQEQYANRIAAYVF